MSDHTCNVGSAKQASDFAMANEHVINHARKNHDCGGDTGSALEDMDHFDFTACKPNLKPSTASDEAKKKQDDRHGKRADRRC